MGNKQYNNDGLIGGHVKVFASLFILLFSIELLKTMTVLVVQLRPCHPTFISAVNFYMHVKAFLQDKP